MLSSEMHRKAYGASMKWKLFPEGYANHSILMMLPLCFSRTWSHQVALWVLVVFIHFVQALLLSTYNNMKNIDYKPLRLKMLILTALYGWWYGLKSHLHAVAETRGMHICTPTTQSWGQRKLSLKEKPSRKVVTWFLHSPESGVRQCHVWWQMRH